MARVVASSQRNTPSAAATTIVVPPPPHQVGDLLVIFVCQQGASGSNTFTVSSGWTIQSQQSATDTRGRHAFIYRYATVSNTAAPTITSAVSAKWTTITTVVRGADPTTPVQGSATIQDDVANIISTPNYTTTANNTLLLYGMAMDNNTYYASVAEVFPEANYHIIDHAAADAGANVFANIQVGWRYKKSTGAVTGVGFLPSTYGSSNTNTTAGSIVIAINDDGNANHPGYTDPAISPAEVLDPMRGAENPTGTANYTTVWASTINGRTNQDGQATGGNTPPFGLTNTGYEYPFTSRRTEANTANMYTWTKDMASGGPSNKNVTTGFVNLAYSVEFPVSALAVGLLDEGGMTFSLIDNNGTSRWRAWPVGGSDMPWSQKGINHVMINPASTTNQLDQSGTSPDLTNIKYHAESHVKSVAIGSFNFKPDWLTLYLMKEIRLVGGSASVPADFFQLKQASRVALLRSFLNVGNGAASFMMPLSFGGSEASYIQIKGAAIEFPGAINRVAPTVHSIIAHREANDCGVTIRTSSGDTCKLINSSIYSETKWYFNMVSGVAGTIDFTNLVINNAGTVTLRDPGNTISSVIFESCDTATLNAVVLDKPVFNAPTSAPCITVTSTAESGKITNPTFSNNAIGHSVTITATGTHSWSGYKFVNSKGKAARTFRTTTDVDATNEIITTDAAHGYANGEPIYYQKHAGVASVGLTDGTLYYARAVSSTTISLHATAADAIANVSKINLTATGSETHSLYSFYADVYNNSGGAITINVSGGGDTPTVRNSSASSTTVQNAVSLTVSAVNSAGTAIQNARVFIKAASGGPLTAGTTISTGLTDIAGNYTDSFAYTSSQPITGWVRKSSSSPLYKPAALTGAISTSGFSAAVVMVADE